MLTFWLTCGVINLVIVSINQILNPVSMIGFKRGLITNFLLGPISTLVFSGLLLEMGLEAIDNYMNKDVNNIQ